MIRQVIERLEKLCARVQRRYRRSRGMPYSRSVPRKTCSMCGVWLPFWFKGEHCEEHREGGGNCLSKVYVLERGAYGDTCIVGVFSSPEKAMAAWQPPRPGDSETRSPHHTYTWGERTEFGWEFGADWEDAASIQEYEVDEA